MQPSLIKISILSFSRDFISNELQKIHQHCNFSKIIPISASHENDTVKQHERCGKSLNRTGHFPAFRARGSLRAGLRSLELPAPPRRVLETQIPHKGPQRGIFHHFTWREPPVRKNPLPNTTRHICAVC